MSTQKNKVQLKCCLCASDAGQWVQHPVCDAGYGICSECVAKRSGIDTPDEIRQFFGVAGVNFKQPTFEMYGRRFRVSAIFADTPQGVKAANAFMTRTPDHGFLSSVNGLIIIADCADKGEVINPLQAFKNAKSNSQYEYRPDLTCW